jgi:hypothetical protein
MIIAQAAQPQPQGQLEHGGKIAPIEGMDKHQVEQTGAQNGSGEYTPGMGGGLLQ